MTETSEKRPRRERKENAERRRRQLLDAARRSILAHGLSRTTLATVAEEAALSQGVAVFYFKSKAGLLTETLRDLYQGYEDHWSQALAAAGSDPVARLAALIAADFHPRAAGPEVLPIWFAFWGELRFSDQYAAVAEEFDARRQAELCRIWARILPGAGVAEQMADWMDTLTDGYWQRLHLAAENLDREAARAGTCACLQRLAPALAGRL